MSTYNYRCLPPGCIRLLRLNPHEDDNAPIRCQLVEYSLASARRKGTHLYEALSYCWGSPSKSQTAFVDEGLLHITENLHAALLRLRDPALERIIWIDAICINQDDLDEKGLQVQLMAEIYARASCVIVWLENVTGDCLIDGESQAGGSQVLRVLEAAASRHKAVLEDKQDWLAVEKLLGRPWFRRIWVLQEVAAARHVLIMCKFAEIDGQAFCSGLNSMSGGLLLRDEDAQSRIRSTVNLIKGATLRSKGVVNASEQFSLQISSLGYLIERHYIREATDRRDKIYALLGMSTDTSTGLLPNYQMSWNDLFPHVVKSLLPESLSVTTFDEPETALIRIQGYVLATVARVENEDSWDDQQLVTLYQEDPYIHSKKWTLQATTKRIQRDDILCRLRGMSLPTIVRAHDDYCSIVAIAVDADIDKRLVPDLGRKSRQVEFLLTWSLKAETCSSDFSGFLNARGLSPPSCIGLQMPDDLETIEMLLETRQRYLAILRMHSFMVAFEDVGQREHPKAEAVARKFLDVVDNFFLDRNHSVQFKMIRGILGKMRGDIEVTEDLLVELASAPEWEPMAFVLDTQGKPVTLTENIMTAAAKNKRHCRKIMEVLLDGRDDQTIITERCLKAALAHRENSVAIMDVLLNNKAAQIDITENVLVELVTGNRIEDAVLRRIVKIKGNKIAITENVLVAAAKNEGTSNMYPLLYGERCQITITEKVLTATATNSRHARENLYWMFYKRTSNSPTKVTNQVLMTVAGKIPDSEGREILYQHMVFRGLR